MTIPPAVEEDGGRVSVLEWLCVMVIVLLTSIVAVSSEVVTGEATGEATGELTGEATGETTGELTGEATGEATDWPDGLDVAEDTGGCP